MVLLCVVYVYMNRSCNITYTTTAPNAIANTTPEDEIDEIKAEPVRGKTPTCETPQRGFCVQPTYPDPTQSDCLVRSRQQKIDASGAWLLPPGFMYKFDVSFANAVLDRTISGGTVLELGAGLGCYTAFFQTSGKIKSIVGYEGAANVGSMSENYINRADLTVPQEFGEKSFDWVLCMEVAEHIPPAFEAQFLLNVVTPAKKGVVLTWGQPGQGGVGHVNLRSNEYVIEMMKGFGLEYDAITSDYLRSQAHFNWFKGTAMVFKTTM